MNLIHEKLMWLCRTSRGVFFYDLANVICPTGEGWYEMEMVGMDARQTRLGFLRGTRFYAHQSEMVDVPPEKIKLVDKFTDQEFEMSAHDLPKYMMQLAQINMHGKHYAHVYREKSSGLPVMRRQGKLTLWYPDTTWADLMPSLDANEHLYINLHEDTNDFLQTDVLEYDVLDIQVY